MKLTQKHKVYLAIVVVGVGVVLMDWFAFGTMTSSPSSAAADAGPAASPGAPQPKPTPKEQPAAAAPAAIHTGALARRLQHVAEAHAADPAAVRDAFTPSESWVPRKPQTEATSAQDEALRQRLKQFSASYRLSAVIGNGARPLAVVKGPQGTQGLTLNQQVDGFRLVEIGDRWAVFEHEGNRVQLDLPGQSP